MKELKCFYLLLLVTVIVNGQHAKEADTEGEFPKGKSEIANTKLETESKSDTSKPEGSSLKAFLNRVKSESNYGRFDSKAAKKPERAAYLSKIKNIMKVRENSGGSTSPRIGVGTGGSIGGPYGNYEDWKDKNAFDGWNSEDQDTDTIQGTQFPHYHDYEPWNG